MFDIIISINSCFLFYWTIIKVSLDNSRLSCGFYYFQQSIFANVFNRTFYNQFN